MSTVNHVLRTPQAAAYVGLSTSTLEKLRLTGNGPVYQKAGPKIVVYRIEDLDAWLSAHRRTSTSDTGSLAAPGTQ
jgi:predicted DNA-binding transcriptional regulator AlpA